MRRERLRPMPDAATLASLYAVPHQHTRWVDHRLRVAVTVAVGRHMAPQGASVADLSCGDGAIAVQISNAVGGTTHLGDLAPAYQYEGPIEETIWRIPHVDMFICSETIEHLDDPDSVLTAIRHKARMLILSTPDGEWDANNPEHVWGWDAEAVEGMLRIAGWVPAIHTTLDLRPAGYVYSYQIWACT